MFQSATSFNQSLTSWTPTACTNMSNMFRGTTASYTSSLFNHDLANWRTTATHAFFFSPNGTTDTSETDPKSPFTPVPPALALAFTGTPSITLPIYEIANGTTVYVDYGNGTTVTSFSGNVTGSGIVSIYGSFTVFGSENWSGVGSVTRIVSWSSRIIDFSNSFRNATSLTSVPSTLPAAVRNTRNMFLGATSFNQNLSGWDVASVTNMEGMFEGATAFTSAGMSAWRTTAVTNVTNMFRSANASYTNTTSSGLFLENLRSWQTGNVNSRDKFFCPDNSTDTTTTDPKSPFS
jgi:surface protein